MTTFIETWNAAYEADPADTDQAKLYANELRAHKVNIRERIAVDHNIDGNGEDGTHLRVSLDPQGSDPVKEASDHGQLFAKVALSRTELHYKDDTNAALQITAGGVLLPNTTIVADPNIAQKGIYIGQRVFDSTDVGWWTCITIADPGTWTPDVAPKTVRMFSGTVIPAGWLLCDGTLSTPDLGGKFIVGHDPLGDTDFDTIAKTGGAKTHVLTEAEMPAHTHTIETRKDNFFGNFGRGVQNTFAGNQTTSSTGGDAAHENLPPYYVLAYIMKKPVV